MIKACVFDLDGTLLDTIESIRYFVNLTIQKYGIEQISTEECKQFVGDGAKNLIKRTLSSRKISDAELEEKILLEYNAAYLANPLYLTEAYKGIYELIDGLRARGIKIAVVSNKPDFVTRPIVKHFFGENIDLCFGKRDGVPLKPSPDSTLEAIRMLGAESMESAFIGDTGVDMQTGRAAGFALVIGVRWGFRKENELLRSGADVVVSSPLDILTEVMKLDS